ncbi:MAG: SDR family NAD(P)-dependent oxidoreductase, partial [Vulcanimicrobiaceae bacterium]
MLLKDKVAIVTGGDTGIGKAISLAMAREGAAVVIDYHGDVAPANALVEEIENLGARAVAVGANVADPQQVESLIAAAVNACGGLDILVNNAGIEEKHPFLETPFELFRKVIDINLGGVWLCTQAAAKQMVKQKRGGRIVNISSIHEELAMPTNAPYCAAKGGVRMLMRTVALELAKEHITVNDVAPGAVDTPMDAALKVNKKEYEALLAEIPLARMAKPEEVAGLVV